MNVRGAQLDSPVDQVIDQPNDRRLAGRVLQALQILDAVVDGVLGMIGQDPLDGAVAVAVGPRQGRLDVGRHPDPAVDLPPQAQAESIDHEGVERIGDRQHQALALVAQGDRLGVLEKLRADPIGERRILGIVVRARQGQVEARSKGLGHLALADQPKLDQAPVEALARVLAQARGPLQAGGIQGPAVDQARAQSLQETVA